MAPAALRALVDDDVTTAQSEFWELGDGACSENGLRLEGGKKNLHTGFTALPVMTKVPDHSVSELQSELLKSYTILELEEMLCGILYIRKW